MAARSSVGCSTPMTAPAEAAARAQETEAEAQPRRWALWLAVSVALFLAWRAVAWGVAGWLVGGDEVSPERAHSALAWVPDHPTALFLAAQADQDDKPDEARQHLQVLLETVPSHAWGWLLTAELSVAEGAQEVGRRQLRTAQSFAPWDGNLHYRAADLWLRLGDLPAALAAWDRAMRADARWRNVLYPRLLRLVEVLGDASPLAPLAASHPEWWLGFFRQAARPPTELALVRQLYGLEGSVGEARAQERAVFLDRLMQDGQWLEAYLTWLGSLDARQRRHLGLVYNGGFELPLSRSGFGWRTGGGRGVKVERKRTYGISGDRAVALQYRGRPVADGHLYQIVLLQPGSYRLTYRARPDSLRAAEGVRVAVRCRAGTSQRLAHGERLLGVYQWRSDVVKFTVPAEGCPAQEIRLEVVTERQRDRTLKGVLWLDDFRLRPEGNP